MKQRSSATSTLSPNLASFSRALLRWSRKRSPIAWSLTLLDELIDCSAAPVPRPPQPTRPTLITSLPAAWTEGAEARWVTAAPAATTAEDFRKSRREAPVCTTGSVMVAVSGLFGMVVGVARWLGLLARTSPGGTGHRWGGTGGPPAAVDGRASHPCQPEAHRSGGGCAGGSP